MSDRLLTPQPLSCDAAVGDCNHQDRWWNGGNGFDENMGGKRLWDMEDVNAAPTAEQRCGATTAVSTGGWPGWCASLIAFQFLNDIMS